MKTAKSEEDTYHIPADEYPSEEDTYHIPADEYPPMLGLVIKRQVLHRFKISQAELAEAMGVSRPWLSQLLSGRNAISPELALRLSKVTATDPAYWMDLQTRYVLHQKSIELQASLSELVELVPPASAVEKGR